MASPRRLRLLTGAIVLAVAATGCATGQRPSFDALEPALSPTGDAAVDAVLQQLDTVAVVEFTADYDILTRFGGLESTATVVQADESRRSVTINDIRFLNGTGTAATCDLVAQECEARINDARVSDVSVTHDFYASSFARRLRVDEGRSIAPATPSNETIAGRPAVCAAVPVSGGTVTYCAVEGGPLARYVGADLEIELTGFDDVADETKFATS